MITFAGLLALSGCRSYQPNGKLSANDAGNVEGTPGPTGPEGHADASTTRPPTGSPDAGVTSAPDAETPIYPPGTLDVPINIKEVAGVGATEFPVSVVVPLPRGTFQDPRAFRLVDSNGTAVPAQFEVLNRQWARDGSIRHLLVHFAPTVAAWTGGTSGTAQYHLKDDGVSPAPATPVTVQQAADATVLQTGGLSIRVQASPFRITTPTGDLALVLHDKNGAVQRSFDASNVTIEVEERGPMRAVLRAESPAVFNGAGNITHGWALRIYLYAGKPFVKLDVQLQNSASNTVFSEPLYFEDFAIELPTGGTAVPAEVRAETVTADPTNQPPGTLGVGGVQVLLRNFWQTWPNRLAVDATGKVSIDLFPAFGAKAWQGAPSTTGLYWLEDMQHVVKESLLYFGALDPAELVKLGKTFQFHPVGTVPVEWYAQTEVTLDMGGYFPRRTPVTTTERRLPDYRKYAADPNLSIARKFGWDSFGIDLARKNAPNGAGGWPYSVSRFFVSQDPADYWLAEDFAMGELNIRPQWMAQYKYDRDYSRLTLSENPYGSWSWRKFNGTYGYNPMPGHLAGSGQDAKPRDDQHGWFYQVEEAYYATGNFWIRDWYRFVAEFRKARLHERDPYPDLSARAVGHSLAHALQAFRVTGDMEIPQLLGDYLRNHLQPLLDPQIGGYKPRPDYQAEAVFQIGYLTHAIISYAEDLPAHDPVAVDIVRGFVNWNVNYANFGYYVGLTTQNARSDGTAMSFADPQAWYGVLAGDQAALDQLETYVRSGIGGGARPFVDLTDWSGDYLGRITSAALSMRP